MCDWLPQVLPYRIHHCHHLHYAHHNFNTLSVIIIPENFPIIPRYSENLPDYSGIFPDSFPHLLCSKLFRHNTTCNTMHMHVILKNAKLVIIEHM